MASKLYDLGSAVTVKTRDSGNIQGSIFNYVKYTSLGKPALYQVKLNNGKVIIVWPEEIMEQVTN